MSTKTRMVNCRTCGKSIVMFSIEYCDAACEGLALKGSESDYGRTHQNQGSSKVIPMYDFSPEEYEEWQERAGILYHDQKDMTIEKAEKKATNEIMARRKRGGDNG